MKKKLLHLFLTLSLLCAGCGGTQAEQEVHTPPAAEQTQPEVEPEQAVSEETQTEPDESLLTPEESGEESAEEPTLAPILEDYLDDLDILASPVREYGESVSHLQMETDFVARILYPDGETDALDEAVERWVLNLSDAYRAESAGSSANGDTAELTVDYSSYLIGESLVSVKLTGIYDRPYLAHPVDVSASFNADRETGALLSLDDILADGGAEALRQMVLADTEVSADEADAHLLDQWLLTPDGLEITLVRGTYLPMSAGTVVLNYSTEELQGILDTTAEEPEEPAEEEVPAPVTEAPETLAVDPSRPMLALTFDDGPSAHTARLLDAFASHGGKGTFYVVGNMLDSRADTLRRMAAEGHEIGGHSWNHRQLTKLNEEELTEQLMHTRAKIYGLTGVDATTMRPPYGSCNSDVRAKAKELGIALVNWSVDTLDWKTKDADAVYESIMTQARDGSIILCHDLHKTTVDALERAIPALIAEGYQLVTVSDLLGGDLTPGALYYKR